MTVVLAAVVLATLTRPRIGAIVFAGGLIWRVGGPLLLVTVGGVVGVAALWRRARVHAARARSGSKDELLALDLVALAVAGGLSFTQAVRLAEGSVGDAVRADLETHRRHATVGATAPSEHRAVEAMFSAARRSQATGAALAPELAAAGTSIRRDAATAARERIGRLPVVLLFPLALMILPGFVLMTVGPTVISGLSRLGL